MEMNRPIRSIAGNEEPSPDRGGERKAAEGGYEGFRYLVRSDLYRAAGGITVSLFLYHLLANPGFKYSFFMRLCKCLRSSKWTRHTLFYIARLVLERCKYKYGIDIPYPTVIGSGFYIGHFSGIVVNGKCVFGKNCNISQGVTVGEANRGKRKGCPTIGDNVYIGPGAKVFGNIKVGDDAAIGANCVVTKDVPDNAVVAGVPGRVISFEGSKGYINRTDY